VKTHLSLQNSAKSAKQPVAAARKLLVHEVQPVGEGLRSGSIDRQSTLPMPQPGLASGGKVLTETVLASAQIEPPLNSRIHVLEASKIKDLDGNGQYAESALPGKQILTKPKLANSNLQVQKVQQVEGLFSESPDRQSAEPTTKSGITSEGKVYVEAGTLTSVQKKITVASKAKGVDSPMQISETESEAAAGQQTYLTRETNSKGNAARERSIAARCSLRLNNTCSSDGISKGDEDTLEKSMKRTAWKNLDGPALQQRQPSPTEGNTISTNTLESLPSDRCISSLHSLGFSMGRSQQDTMLAIKALKQIDIDRTRVETKKRWLIISHHTQSLTPLTQVMMKKPGQMVPYLPT
jgi:hypothetical protein